MKAEYGWWQDIVGIVEDTLSALASFAASADQTSAASASSVPPSGPSFFLPSPPLVSFSSLQKQKKRSSDSAVYMSKSRMIASTCLSTPDLLLLPLMHVEYYIMCLHELHWKH